MRLLVGRMPADHFNKPSHATHPPIHHPNPPTPPRPPHPSTQHNPPAHREDQRLQPLPGLGVDLVAQRLPNLACLHVVSALLAPPLSAGASFQALTRRTWRTAVMAARSCASAASRRGYGSSGSLFAKRDAHVL
jgi:hypothetical protein